MFRRSALSKVSFKSKITDIDSKVERLIVRLNSDSPRNRSEILRDLNSLQNQRVKVSEPKLFSELDSLFE